MIKHGLPVDHGPEKDKAIAWFNKSYKDVRGAIPKERRFESSAKDGFKPLCEFLHISVPLVKDDSGFFSPTSMMALPSARGKLSSRLSSFEKSQDLELNLPRAEGSAIIEVGEKKPLSSLTSGTEIWRNSHSGLKPSLAEDSKRLSFGMAPRTSL
ncbi:uncharacterized protein MAM_08458 [Metarhizium album ARSEF 1941]|uniref:Uncharacterized protein n=1 Tax=Metarhizium album (strain ARSEF 1941) TaxID=1081103 RepID=A0A0B2WIJ7_METAS|nr:uncharacterized protein MAM_08458 [Metarhizium album ARSEF 1941]KHN93683.1 hypothetical protein MAM_08458 [Metarhizium album ARSEF 1941]